MNTALNGHLMVVEHEAPPRSGEDTELPIAPEMEWFVQLLSKVPRGANILLGGDPGAGKSTIVQQLALAAARAGESVLIIATEQPRSAVLSRMKTLGGFSTGWSDDLDGLPIHVIDDMTDLGTLPQFLARQVLARGGRFQGASLLIIDSLHAGGGGPSDRNYYASIYEYFRTAGAAGITTAALSHMTKGRVLAGPKSLEHMADVSIILRHGICSRAAYIPKNRFGPSRMEPTALVVDDKTTRIVPSAHSASSAARVRTISAEGPIEIEAALTLPRHEQGFVKAPGFSSSEVAVVAEILARTYPPARILGSLGVTVRGPGGIRFRREYSLPVALAIAAALERKEIPSHLIVVGDVDLRGRVAPLGAGAIRHLEGGFTAGDMGDRDTIVCAVPEDTQGVDCGGWRMADVRSLMAAMERCVIVDSADALRGVSDEH